MVCGVTTNTWFPEYADASNYAVGVYMAGIAYGKWESLKIAETFVFSFHPTSTIQSRYTIRLPSISAMCSQYGTKVGKVGSIHITYSYTKTETSWR
jgi:hypothetical protein